MLLGHTSSGDNRERPESRYGPGETTKLVREDHLQLPNRLKQPLERKKNCCAREEVLSLDYVAPISSPLNRKYRK